MLEQLPGRVLPKTRLRIDLDGRARSLMSSTAHTRDWCFWRWGSVPMRTSAFVPPAWVGPETDLSGGDLA